MQDYNSSKNKFKEYSNNLSKMKKKTIILHIGRHKSGTSSLQRFLSDNRVFLDKKGYYYPNKLRQNTAHHPLAHFYNNKYFKLTEKDLSEIHEFWLEIKEYDKVIISSEAFQNINPENMKKDIEGFNLKIVIYLRNQVSYLLSSYSQFVKANKTTMTLNEYEINIFYNVNYFNFIEKWKKAFPHAEILVQSFEKKNLLDEDIRKDFLVNSKICKYSELEFLEFSSKDQNPSIGGSLLEFKRLLNYTDFDTVVNTKEFYQVLQKIALKNNKYKLKQIMPIELYELVKKKYNKSNRMLSQKYFHNKLIKMKKPDLFKNQFTLDIENTNEIITLISYENKKISEVLKNYYLNHIISLI